MNGHGLKHDTVALPGLDGANPLGFLASLGTLVTLHGAGERSAQLFWVRRRTWTPVIQGTSATDPGGFSEIVAGSLKGQEITQEADDERAQAVQLFEAAKKVINDKRKELRSRGLRGADRKAAIEAEIAPLEREYHVARSVWLQALSGAVPRAELALGKRIDCTPEEYREHAGAFLADSAPAERDALDLLAAFGTDVCVNTKSNTIESTPFQFITGSGHQFFLQTVRELIENVTADRVRCTLFEPWTYSDEGLSMRWDPAEDRRYALRDRDPTASGNKPRTMWMANLLGYRALSLFPSAPQRGRLRVVGWVKREDEPAFTWPLWKFPASMDAIRSLVALPELRASQPEHRILHARGIVAAFRARRIKVGAGANFKLNFSPARAV